MKENESKSAKEYKHLSVQPDTFRRINILKAENGYSSYDELLNEEFLEE